MPDYIDRINVNDTEYIIRGQREVVYATCNTTASTAAKVVSGGTFPFDAGNILGVRFATGNTADVPTLNVNSAGAKSIYVGNSIVNGTTNVLKWSANTMMYFMFDGSAFRFLAASAQGIAAPARGANTWVGTSSTSATMQAKTATIDNYVLTKGSLVSITFSTANTYTSAGITLNVNSTGAKDIYYNGAVTSSTNTLLWDANTTLTFVYDGTGYVCICMSRAGSSYTATSPVNITSDVISLSDGYGDIKNPYGTKNEHYVLAGGSSTIATYNDITTSSSDADIDNNLSIEAGTYVLSAHVVAGASSGSKNITLVCFLNGNYATSTALTGTGAIDTDASVEFTSATATTVEMWVSLSGTRVSTTFSNIKVSNASPSYPEFRALTVDDLPNTIATKSYVDDAIGAAIAASY